MEVDTTIAQWSLVVGFVAPLVLAFIQQSKWSSKLKAVVALAFSAIAAVPTAYLSGDLTGEDWLTSALVIGIATATFYQGFWKPTNVAPAIEAATDLNRTGGS